MARILDRGTETLVAEALSEALDEAGFGPEEAIPGLVQTIIDQAENTSDPEQALDEAANMLADGRV